MNLVGRGLLHTFTRRLVPHTALPLAIAAVESIPIPTEYPAWTEIPDYGDMGPLPAFLRDLPGRVIR